MTFLALTFTACLVSSPDHCEQRQMLFDPRDLSLMTCMTRAQQPLSEWVAQHPDYEVTRHFRSSTR